MTLTTLERAVLQAYHLAYAGDGFPRVEDIMVTGRENSGSGRFVHISADAATGIGGRTCDLPFTVEMESVEGGLGHVVFLADGRVDMLEFHTFSGGWDGVERPWRFALTSGDGDA